MTPGQFPAHPSAGWPELYHTPPSAAVPCLLTATAFHFRQNHRAGNMLAILTVRIRDFYPVSGILQLDFPVLTILDTPITR
ncbi:hypothetical protein G3823_005087 [Escherichia coli]|nr:hypothetical protein [Escherichia coli]EFJ1100208.1 hypothetical protein [Escherichia coli]EFJ2911142.1 hypothetical protein [Escherichia coli]EHK7518716.1 hypothetical protein [Escherichia coli]